METDSGHYELRDGTLTIRVRGNDSGYVLAVEGELDLANAGTLELALERAEASGNEPLCVDLSRLEFIDSTGIALLVNAHRRLAASKRLSLISSRSPAVQRVMSLTGLESELPFVLAS